MEGAAAVDAYLAALRPDFAAALSALRAQLRALLPDHAECISYAMPGFRAPDIGKTRGKMVAGYAAFTHHLGFYPHSGSVIGALAPAELDGFKYSKSGVLFTPDRPLPAALIARIVALRQAEIAG